MSLCVFPAGGGRPALQGLVLDDPAVALGALKMSEDGGRLIARLFEPTGRGRHVGVRLPALDLAVDVALGPFEIKTLAIDPGTRRISEVDLLERETRQP
jgi:alpha-mannosidase